MSKEWIKQLEHVNQQIATIAQIKKTAEDEQMQLHERWQEYLRKYEGKDIKCLYWIKESRVEPYKPGKWLVWVYTDMWPTPFGYVGKCLLLVQFTPDGWIAEQCPLMG